MRRSLLLAAALAMTCGGPDHSHDLASVDVHASGSGPPVISAIGGTLQLVADLKDAAGRSLTGLTISWSSSNAGIATVDANGLVTAVANGTATIVATVGTEHGSLDVTVAQAVSTVQVTPATDTVPPNSTVAYSATALDVRGDPVAGAPAATWASDNPKVTIDASGNATVGAVSALTTVTITATIGGVAGHATLTVDPSSIPIACIVVSGGGVTLTSIGQTAQLSALAYATCPNSNPIAKTFSWSSSDPGRVSVDAGSGLVTAHANTPSPVTITASAGGKNGTATVSVAQAAASVAVGPGSSATLTSLGATVQLSAVARDALSNVISGAAFTWASDTLANATVSATGLVQAMANGSANITASSGGVKSPNFPITVQQVVASVVVSTKVAGASTTLASIGDTLALQASGFDANSHAIPGTVAGTFTWHSDATGLATVDTSGVVTAVANGTANITATSANSVVSASFPVTIQQAAISVTVSPSTASIAEGATQQFTASANDARGNPVPITWSSSDTTIATINSSGLATASSSKSGTVTITATGGGKSGTASLTVMILTINNYLAWCDVTAKVNGTLVASFGTSSAQISEPVGTTVALTATPHPGFTTARWQGTTTATGDANGDATYVMGSAASQTITACCPFTNGTGCPF